MHLSLPLFSFTQRKDKCASYSFTTKILAHSMCQVSLVVKYSIFKDNSVISSIPNYFNNSETPIICYKYNNPIRSTIFNFNKIVTDMYIDSNTPDS